MLKEKTSSQLNKIKIFQEHNQLYYNENKSIISDYEYDVLKKEIISSRQSAFQLHLGGVNDLFYSQDVGAQFPELGIIPSPSPVFVVTGGTRVSRPVAGPGFTRWRRVRHL